MVDSRQNYDLIVIGAGPGGYTAAIQAVEFGKKVLLIEQNQLGGCCLNRGCIPTKALLHSAKLYDSIKSAERFGVVCDTPTFCGELVSDYKENTVRELRTSLEQLLVSKKITILYGKARIEEQGIVSVQDELYYGDYIMIATGANPVIPKPFQNLKKPVFTSDELLTSREDIQEILIVGGGVIGVEMAFYYGTIGRKVILIEQENRLLPNFDREISQNLAQILKKKRIEVLTSTKLISVSELDLGYEVYYEPVDSFNQTEGKKIKIQNILVAIGRKPNTQCLFGEKLAEWNHVPLTVNSQFETGLDRVYAIGDAVMFNQQLAHKAMLDAKKLMLQLFGHDNGDATHLQSMIPSCVYIQPEIAVVGLSEAEAKDQGMEVKVVKQIMTSLGKHKILQGERSFLKLTIDVKHHCIVGVVLMCEQASEMITELTYLIQDKVSLDRLQLLCHPHPSLSEAIGDCISKFQEERKDG